MFPSEKSLGLAARSFAKAIEDSSSSDPDLCAVFRGILSRNPEEDELTALKSYMDDGGDLAGLIQLLVMTNEFAFVD